MANVKITKDSNGVRWLELMCNGSGTLLEIRNEQEALQIITALQQSVQLTALRRVLAMSIFINIILLAVVLFTIGGN